MITFDDITVDIDDNLKRKLNNKYYTFDDLWYCDLDIYTGNRITGFKYSIIGWDHYYNYTTGDYDVVFEGSHTFFSITRNMQEDYNTLTEKSEEFAYKDMEWLAMMCEPELP